MSHKVSKAWEESPFAVAEVSRYSESSFSIMAAHCADSPLITLVAIANHFRGCLQSQTSPPLQFRLVAVAVERHSFVTISNRVLQSHCALLQLE